jgi:DNA-binding transcriptional LysR family regulator
VAKLARGIKGDLFKKSGNRLELTDIGSILQKACEKAFYILEEAEERMAAAGSKGVGTIKIGATVEFGTTQLVKTMKPFIADNPGIHLDFQFRHELIKPLLKDEFEFIIDCKDQNADGIEKTRLFREEYVVIASRAFVSKYRIRKPADLASCPVLSVDKGGEWWGNFLNALPLARRPRFGAVTELSHIRAIINGALEGLGVGFVPRYCVTKELKTKTLVDVFPELKLLEDNFYAYQKTGKAVLERHRRLLEFLKRMTAQLERP